MNDHYQRIESLVLYLFGEDKGPKTFQTIKMMLEEYSDRFSQRKTKNEGYFKIDDVILITYGDSLKQENEPPLRTLLNFHNNHLENTINTIHLLPFYPFSSDDGFSVIDYLAVNPNLGDWDDILKFQSQNINLMFDGVINHVSSQSTWFKKFLEGDPRFLDYFIVVDPETDLSSVTRPRTSPLLTSFETINGKKSVWTTFSADQIDLNYKNPDTFLDILKIFFTYIEYGAKLIRLDAIAYLWKEIGTTCIHLPQTHAIIQLLRAIIDELSLDVLLITETNVPHVDNISYFGDGTNEAHMVYQFSLPPLIAHALLSGSAEYLTRWASNLTLPSGTTTFFNFTASHDGIGLLPLMGQLPQKEIDKLLETTILHGGKVSSRTNPDGSVSPYELNITYFDLLNNFENGEPQSTKVDRFIISQAIPLALAGIPGIYIHSLLGSKNYYKGVEESGITRAINRQKLDINEVENELVQQESLRYQVFSKYQNLLKIRTAEKAFHPNAKQEIINYSNSVFFVKRISQDAGEKILAIHNVSNHHQLIDLQKIQNNQEKFSKFQDLITGNIYNFEELVSLELSPYQMVWLKPIK